MVALRLLGTIDITVAGRTAASVLAQPRRLALLAFLAAATPRGSHRRDRLLALFWPESSHERARNSLNQAVFQLRRSLGDDVVRGTGDELGIDKTLLWSDVAAFDDALDRGDPAAALDVYGGDLLPGFHVADAPEFDRWLQLERDRLRRRAVDAALALADADHGRGNGIAAIERLRRAASWAPFDEGVVRRVMGLLAEHGDTAGALREYERLRELLATELDLEPAAATQELVATLRTQAPIAPRALSASAATTSAAAHEARPAAAHEARPAATGTASAAPGPRPVRRAAVAVLISALAILGAALGMLPRASGTGIAQPETVLDGRRVFVAAFDNRTGDAALDPVGYMVADWLAHGFTESGMVRVVPFSTTVQELSAADGAADAARRAGAGLVVSGAYYRTAEGLIFQGRLLDVATGELLRGVDATAPPADPVAGVTALQRRALGSLATLLDERLQSWPEPAGHATSLEAYRLFAEGMDLFLTANRHFGSPDGARVLRLAAAKFMAAATHDTAFSTALIWAGFAHFGAGDVAAARVVVDGLQTQSLPAWNRAVLAHQRALLDDDGEAAYRTAVALAELSPDSEWLFKLAFAAQRTRRTAAARAALLRIDPDRGWIREFPSYWRVRAEVHHVLEEHEAELTAARRALALAGDDVLARTLELWALAALGRTNDIAARLEPRIAAADPFALRDLNTTLEELHAHGHRRHAERLLRRLLPAAAAAAADAPPPVRGSYARLLERAGRHAEARAVYTRIADERPHAVDPRVRLAILAARDGDVQPARTTDEWLTSMTAEALVRAAPQDLQFFSGSMDAWLAVTRARLAVARGDADGALDLLHRAVGAGLRHTHALLHDDADFAPLRREPRMQTLISSRD